MPRDVLRRLPNTLSLTRFVLAAAFVVADGRVARLALIATAGASDFLDGWLARRHGLASRWGALLDALADRAFVFAAVVSFLFRGEITVGQYFVLMSRDIATAIGFLVVRAVPWLRDVKLAARFPGKVVTALQLAVLVTVLAYRAAVPWLIVAVAAASVWAIADYTRMLWRARSGRTEVA